MARSTTRCHHGPVSVIRIRRDDAPLLAAAVARFRGVDGARSFVDAAGTLSFVAVEASEVTGWCWGYHLPRPDDSSMLYLHEFDVDEAHRRQGIGRALMAALLSAGREAGATKAFLVTGEANAPARSLYESIGGSFAAQGPTVSYWFTLA